MSALEDAIESLGANPTDAELEPVVEAFLPAMLVMDDDLRLTPGGAWAVVRPATTSPLTGADLVAQLRVENPDARGFCVKEAGPEVWIPLRLFPEPPIETPVGWFQDLRNRYQDLLAEYGGIAVGVYFTIFFGSIAAFYVAIELGFDVGGGNLGEVGKVGAAYAATKVLQPVRILATLVLTPIVAGVKHRVSGAD
jgi:hypothetical protein